MPMSCTSVFASGNAGARLAACDGERLAAARRLRAVCGVLRPHHRDRKRRDRGEGQ